MKNTTKIIDLLLLLFVIVMFILILNEQSKPKPVNIFDIYVNSGYFPCYKLADSLYGIEDRGTDIWSKVASCEGEAFNYSCSDNGIYTRTYDYHIDISYDTVWLYNEEGVLLIKGKFDSLSSFINLDNDY